MSKPLVVIVGVADWAGSGYQACCSVNHVGEFGCRHISMFSHPFEFPTDVFMSIYPNSTHEHIVEPVRAVNSEEYGNISDLLGKADIIHLWNTYPGERGLMAVGLPIDFRKVKVVTMTGSLYRKNHREINQQLSELRDCKLTVQNPMLKFPDEIESVFIPHAVDVNLLKPVEKREKIIGTYRPQVANSIKPIEEEINLLQGIVKNYPGWHVDLDYSMSWEKRIQKLSKCAIFVQDIKSYIDYWGRSALEACALGIPTITNFSINAIPKSENKIQRIPILNTQWDSIDMLLEKLIEDEDYRKNRSQESRRWVENYFSYPVIGKMYSDLYDEI